MIRFCALHLAWTAFVQPTVSRGVFLGDFSRFGLGVIHLPGALGGGLEGVFQSGLPDDLACLW